MATNVSPALEAAMREWLAHFAHLSDDELLAKSGTSYEISPQDVQLALLLRAALDAPAAHMAPALDLGRIIAPLSVYTRAALLAWGSGPQPRRFTNADMGAVVALQAHGLLAPVGLPGSGLWAVTPLGAQVQAAMVAED